MAGRDGSVLSRIDEPRFRQAAGVISPDGNRVAVAEPAEGGADLWLYDLRRGARSRLTTNDQAVTPTWMPDGRSLLYEGRAASGQGFAIKRVAADGSGRVEEIGPGRYAAVSPDGTFVFCSLPDADGMRLWYRPLADAKAEARRFVDQAFYFIAAAPSPDGQFVAYQAEAGMDRSEVYLRRFPPGEGVWQVSSNGGTSPRWSRDGRLFFAQSGDIFEVSITTEPEVQLDAPKRLFTRTSPGGGVPAGFDVSPDGTRFLIYEPAGDTTQEALVVVQHWFVEFDR
jgi:Tol biopolymer transport system component